MSIREIGKHMSVITDGMDDTQAQELLGEIARLARQIETAKVMSEHDLRREVVHLAEHAGVTVREIRMDLLKSLDRHAAGKVVEPRNEAHKALLRLHTAQ